MSGTGRVGLEGEVFQSEGTACAMTQARAQPTHGTESALPFPGAEKQVERRPGESGCV